MKNLGVAGWIPTRMGLGKQTYLKTEVRRMENRKPTPLSFLLS